ncbi:MAG: hypothetical protein EOO61_17795 [Hymenobacter sp.]|nr:MAG: hypothetical protein EOO61_17795 [Hymenobacter sp.]
MQEVSQSFKFWGHRIDATILNYLENPKEAAASTGHFPLLQWTILFVAALFIAVKYFNRLIDKNLMPFTVAGSKWKTIVALIVLLAISIIPLRGGLQLAPINQSSVYFSQNNYANQAALNPVWNFAFSIKRSREVTENPFVEIVLEGKKVFDDARQKCRQR